MKSILLSSVQGKSEELLFCDCVERTETGTEFYSCGLYNEYELEASPEDIREYAGNSALSGIERAAIILLRERISL